jgi:hypothetical protein
VGCATLSHARPEAVAGLVIAHSHFHGRNLMAEYSKFQQKVIKRYYENRDAIALQRAQELVTELYLTTGKKREKHWDSLALHLGKLGIKPDVIAHLRKEDKPENVATLIKKLMEKG